MPELNLATPCTIKLFDSTENTHGGGGAKTLQHQTQPTAIPLISPLSQCLSVTGLFCTLICRQSFFRTITFSVLHFGAVKYISGRRKMSAAWCFFDLSEAMCQLCKAEVSGTAESR